METPPGRPLPRAVRILLECILVPFTLADPGRVPEMSVPLGSIPFDFHKVFRKNYPNKSFSRPFFGVGALSLGNLGSATDIDHDRHYVQCST